VMEEIRLTLRALWHYAILGSLYDIAAYKSMILMTVLGVLGSFLTYYFLGYSIVYQRGIADYGVESPLAFILSGLLLAQMANPFRYNFPLHLRVFYYVYSRPSPPWLFLLEDWLSIYLKYNLLPVLIYAYALLATSGLRADPLAVALFIPFWVSMNVGLNLLENGLVYHVKRGEPVSLALKFIEYVFSGQYFPLTILPEVLRSAVWLYPLSWAYLVWRKALFEGLGVMSTEFLIYVAASLTSLAAGLAVYRSGYMKIYREGLVL